LQVRRATAADVPVLVQVINRAYRVEAFFVTGDRVTPSQVEERFRRPQAVFLVIDDDAPGRLAGCVFVEVRQERGYFGLLSVDPDRQKQGLGRALVQAAEEHCRAAGCRHIDLDMVNLRDELPAFYQGLGYQTIGQAPFPEEQAQRLLRDAHLVVMSKALG
jgi:N-acetylglutamate synthase-like GNAT family acetyltransferase